MDVLREVNLGPGDEVYASWISHRTNPFDDKLLGRERVPTAPPVFATPVVTRSPGPKVSPLPCPNPLSGCDDYGIKVKGYESAVEAEQKRLEANTKLESDAQRERQRTHAEAQERATKAFVDAKAAAVSAAPVVKDTSGTDIWGALQLASELGRSFIAAAPVARGTRSVKVVVFSDMTDTTKQPRQIDLGDMDVVIGLYNCQVATDCDANKSEWTRALAAAGASVVFLGWEATHRDSLSRFVGRGGP